MTSYTNKDCDSYAYFLLSVCVYYFIFYPPSLIISYKLLGVNFAIYSLRKKIIR